MRDWIYEILTFWMRQFEVQRDEGTCPRSLWILTQLLSRPKPTSFLLCNSCPVCCPVQKGVHGSRLWQAAAQSNMGDWIESSFLSGIAMPPSTGHMLEWQPTDRNEGCADEQVAKLSPLLYPCQSYFRSQELFLNYPYIIYHFNTMIPRNLLDPTAGYSRVKEPVSAGSVPPE